MRENQTSRLNMWPSQSFRKPKNEGLEAVRRFQERAVAAVISDNDEQNAAGKAGKILQAITMVR